MNPVKISLILCVLVALVAALVGCGEKDVPYIVDADELIRYIGETDEARDLFRTTGLINSDSYRFSFESGLLRERLRRPDREKARITRDADSWHPHETYVSRR